MKAWKQKRLERENTAGKPGGTTGRLNNEADDSQMNFSDCGDYSAGGRTQNAGGQSWAKTDEPSVGRHSEKRQHAARLQRPSFF